MCKQVTDVVYKHIDKYVLDVKVLLCATLEIPEASGVSYTSVEYKKALKGILIL